MFSHQAAWVTDGLVWQKRSKTMAFIVLRQPAFQPTIKRGSLL
jgi:hypothetical protein